MKRILIISIALLFAISASAETLESSNKNNEKRNLNTERGFKQSVEFGVSTDFYGDDLYIDGEYIAGYRFNNALFAGVGAGLDWNCYEDSFAIPVYAIARSYMNTRGRLQPMFGVAVGAIFALSNNVYEDRHSSVSPHFSPTIGLNYMINNKSSIYLNVGYLMRMMSSDPLSSYYSHCITVRIGFTF